MGVFVSGKSQGILGKSIFDWLRERLARRSMAEARPRFDDVPCLGPHGFTRIGYTRVGQRDASRTVVCVHGLTRNAATSTFSPQRLAERGVRVVAPDLPGRGRSEFLRTPRTTARRSISRRWPR